MLRMRIKDRNLNKKLDIESSLSHPKEFTLFKQQKMVNNTQNQKKTNRHKTASGKTSSNIKF